MPGELYAFLRQANVFCQHIQELRFQNKKTSPSSRRREAFFFFERRSKINLAKVNHLTTLNNYENTILFIYSQVSSCIICIIFSLRLLIVIPDKPTSSATAASRASRVHCSFLARLAQRCAIWRLRAEMVAMFVAASNKSIDIDNEI